VTTWERYYWAVTLRGRVYVQAMHDGMCGEFGCGKAFPMKRYDGSRWTTVRSNVTGIADASDIEVFKDRAYFRSSYFDGSKVRSSGLPLGVADWYATPTRLYAIFGNGSVRHTDNGTTWVTDGTITLPSGERPMSIATQGQFVYVGTSLGRIYRATF